MDKSMENGRGPGLIQGFGIQSSTVKEHEICYQNQRM